MKTADMLGNRKFSSRVKKLFRGFLTAGVTVLTLLIMRRAVYGPNYMDAVLLEACSHMTTRNAGRKNVVFGLLYLVFTLSAGLYLAKQTGSGELTMTGTQREVLTYALLYANLDAILNIIIGVLLGRLPFVDWLARAVSVLMIAAALLHSGMFYVAGFSLVPFASILVPLGTMLLFGVLLFMGVGVISLKVTKVIK